MRRLYSYSLFVFLLFAAPAMLWGQTVSNPDLNGTVGVSSTPTGWSQIPYTDPASFATGVPQATSDVTSATGPLISAGIAAVPHSGNTCVTGLKMSSGSSTWHEGIQQTVSGFTPGNMYDLNLYQAVVQQSNATDQTGGWDFYRDATYIGMTAPTSTSLAYNNVNVVWNQRTITFQATSTSHLIKLLPADDDANWVSPAGVRMGIDLVTISPAVVLPVTVHLDVIRTNAGAQLAWEVKAEDDVRRCHLEWSQDGERFEHFHTLEVTAPGEFNYEDRRIRAGLTFYRLGFELMSGEQVFSEVKSVSSPVEIAVFTFDNVLHIQSPPGWEDHKLELYSLSGSLVWSGTVQDRLPLDFLTPGMYLVKANIAGQENTVARRKIRVW